MHAIINAGPGRGGSRGGGSGVETPLSAINAFNWGHLVGNPYLLWDDWTLADPEIFISGGPLTAEEGACSGHASVIPYIINKISPCPIKSASAGHPLVLDGFSK